jgi:Ala-tRNA(Pro) deacylase
MAIASKLASYLAKRGIAYEVVIHPRTMSATRTAQASHVPGDRLAKAVVVRDDEGFKVAVLPASHQIELGALSRLLQRPLGLATEEEASELFADCETGAFPAVGSAYGLDVVLDDSLSEQPEVFVEGGDHASLLHLKAEQFGQLMVTARRGRFSAHSQ